MLRQVRTVSEIRYLIMASEVREALEDWANSHRCVNTDYQAVVTEDAQLEFVDGNAVFIMRYAEEPEAEEAAQL